MSTPPAPIEKTIALTTRNQAIDSDGAQYDPGFGTPGQIGELLLTKFLLPFEVASFLLLIAAVGAVVLARRRGGLSNVEEQARYSAMDILRPAYTGTMAEGVGGPQQIGRLFLSDHLLAFEITSIVLLVAAVGGVILGAHSRREEAEVQ